MKPNLIRVSTAPKITLEGLPYRYPMRTAVTLEAELRQIQIAVSQNFPRLMIEPLREDAVSIVGFGPSLHDTWEKITHPCCTVSGAHDFLIERGFIPDYHAECDGRDHKTRHLESPQPGVTYLMASICNPRMWAQLRGCKIKLWHNANGKHVVDWIGEHDPWSILVAGGSVVGLSAIHLMGILGFRRFKLFAFDGSLRGGARHAGKHYGPPQKVIEVESGGRKWKTTPQMFNACQEFLWLVKNPDVDAVFDVHGTSLLTSMIENG